MDPITVNKLLSIADAIETRRFENELPMNTFHKIIESQGQVKDLRRRVRDILRVFKASGWVNQRARSQDTLYLTEDYHNFICAWNSGDYLLPMSQGLANYPPYSDFLDCLRHKEKIVIPQRHDKKSRRDLGRELKDKYGITFVAFDTFRTWAVSVGHAYRSPFDAVLYWGGEWDAERPSLECFKMACIEGYNETGKTSGYANLGRLAHLVCQRLGISFQAFEMKISQFVKVFLDEVTLAPATIRREISGHFRIISIRPRKEVAKEKLSAELVKLRGIKPPELRWLEHRYLEDGMRVNGRLVKLIRWETLK